MKSKYLVTLLAVMVVIMATSLSLYASELDDRIEASAKDSYVFRTYLKDDNVNVQSKDGVVILMGFVSEEHHKSLAQETVMSLPGVKKVDNLLKVKDTSPSVNSDMWIAGKVKTTLMFHRSVSASKTEVDVKKGVVTLRGAAASQAQKELTTEYVKDVDGVKDVQNEMTVVSVSKNPPQTTGEKIDDASITSQVKMALLFHRSTSALGTKIETKQGVVMVHGQADNQAEKDLVDKLISDITGVNGVNNMMTVK